MDKIFAVYMLASGRNGTLYIGVTSNLTQRVWEHREGVVDSWGPWIPNAGMTINRCAPLGSLDPCLRRDG
jgi:hypothetical protein